MRSLSFPTSTPVVPLTLWFFLLFFVEGPTQELKSVAQGSTPNLGYGHFSKFKALLVSAYPVPSALFPLPALAAFEYFCLPFPCED